MNILNIYKIGSKESLKPNTNSEDGVVNYFCAPCFSDAEKMHGIKFDKVVVHIKAKDITDYDAQWIAEICGQYGRR